MLKKISISEREDAAFAGVVGARGASAARRWLQESSKSSSFGSSKDDSLDSPSFLRRDRFAPFSARGGIVDAATAEAGQAYRRRRILRKQMSVDVENFAALTAKHDLRNLANAVSKDDGVHEVIASEKSMTRRLASVLERPTSTMANEDEDAEMEAEGGQANKLIDQDDREESGSKHDVRSVLNQSENAAHDGKDVGATSTLKPTKLTMATLPDSFLETSAATSPQTPVITIITNKPSEENEGEEGDDDVFIDKPFRSPHKETPKESLRDRRRKSSDDAFLLPRGITISDVPRSYGDDDDDFMDYLAVGDHDQRDHGMDSLVVTSSRWKLRSRRRAMMLKALSADCSNEDFLLPSLEEDEADEDDGEEENGDRKFLRFLVNEAILI